jgi:hypothetical protein
MKFHVSCLNEVYYLSYMTMKNFMPRYRSQPNESHILQDVEVIHPRTSKATLVIRHLIIMILIHKMLDFVSKKQRKIVKNSLHLSLPKNIPGCVCKEQVIKKTQLTHLFCTTVKLQYTYFFFK